MSLEVRDIAWVAGLLEGEGCFAWNGTPKIQLNMTDRDVVARAANILGVKALGPWPVSKRTADGRPCKDAHGCRVGGYRSAAWMMTLYPLLGERRQGKIREVLSRWRITKNVYLDGLCPRCRQRPTLERPKKCGTSINRPYCRECDRAYQSERKRRKRQEAHA